MHTYPFSEYMKFIELEDWRSVAELMLSSAKKLFRIGADFAICPDNTIHIAFDLVVDKSPMPWVHIADEVAKVAEKRGFRCLGIMGTKFLMESDVYPSKLEPRGIQWMIPEETDRSIINKIIFEELVYGRFIGSSKEYLVVVIKKFKEKECDAVVLGCTELPLIIKEEESPLPTLDSTRILARAALREACQ